MDPSSMTTRILTSCSHTSSFLDVWLLYSLFENSLYGLCALPLSKEIMSIGHEPRLVGTQLRATWGSLHDSRSLSAAKGWWSETVPLSTGYCERIRATSIYASMIWDWVFETRLLMILQSRGQWCLFKDSSSPEALMILCSNILLSPECVIATSWWWSYAVVSRWVFFWI